MKKVIALALAVVMVFSISLVSMASPSKDPRSHIISTATATATAVSTANYSVTGATAAQAVSGDWTKNADGTWKFAQGGKAVANTWVLAKNPYAGGAAQWFYFDANGNMVTGWVWIKGADGIARRYYLNPASDICYGACFLNGTTPDGQTVDATGAWTVNGKVQTK